MIIVRMTSAYQNQKLRNELEFTHMQSQENCSCNGECWDCDNCGGSVTH